MPAARRASSQTVSSVNAPRPAESKASTYDDGLAAFMSVRRRLFGIAYRMLGSAAEAEDVVQDVWVRWQTADRSLVRDTAAFLATTTTRLAINVMQSARSRREQHAGPWLPEPVDASADPELGAERGEGLEAGILLLLEKLSPTERAAYILREAFDYAYRDIANALRLEEANARQVVTRARQHVADDRRMPANLTEQRRLFEAFIAAAQDGDVASLEGTLCCGCHHVSTRQRVPVARTAPVDGSEVRRQRAAA
jgi:RNA polymerase sigma-70 factor (ECF subfamily)